ncbi:hypothetical protein ACOME3_001962 [Neoechinorhynchus agilis]
MADPSIFKNLLSKHDQKFNDFVYSSDKDTNNPILNNKHENIVPQHLSRLLVAIRTKKSYFVYPSRVQFMCGFKLKDFFKNNFVIGSEDCERVQLAFDRVRKEANVSPDGSIPQKFVLPALKTLCGIDENAAFEQGNGGNDEPKTQGTLDFNMPFLNDILKRISKRNTMKEKLLSIQKKIMTNTTSI